MLEEFGDLASSVDRGVILLPVHTNLIDCWHLFLEYLDVRVSGVPSTGCLWISSHNNHLGAVVLPDRGPDHYRNVFAFVVCTYIYRIESLASVAPRPLRKFSTTPFERTLIRENNLEPVTVRPIFNC